jgi:hypothetical protein
MRFSAVQSGFEEVFAIEERKDKLPRLGSIFQQHVNISSERLTKLSQPLLRIHARRAPGSDSDCGVKRIMRARFILPAHQDLPPVVISSCCKLRGHLPVPRILFGTSGEKSKIGLALRLAMIESGQMPACGRPNEPCFRLSGSLDYGLIQHFKAIRSLTRQIPHRPAMRGFQQLQTTPVGLGHRIAGICPTQFIERLMRLSICSLFIGDENVEIGCPRHIEQA